MLINQDNFFISPKYILIVPIKGPLILFCRIISVECPINLNFPLLTSNQNKGSPKQPISMKQGSKFVGHSTEIVRQRKIKGPLQDEILKL